LITDSITAFKLARLDDQLNDGEVTFGALDTSKFDSATLVSLDNVNKDGFWEAAMDAVTVDGTDVGLTGRTAILDTGTSLIIAPPADAAALMALVPGAQSDGQGGFTVPCTTNASIALTFGGQSFAIDARDIAFLPVSNDLTGDCTAGVSSGQIGGATEWLVGDVFLKNAYFATTESSNIVNILIVRISVHNANFASSRSTSRSSRSFKKVPMTHLVVALRIRYFFALHERLPLAGGALEGQFDAPCTSYQYCVCPGDCNMAGDS
jgi:hypothetical protein